MNSSRVVSIVFLLLAVMSVPDAHAAGEVDEPELTKSVYLERIADEAIEIATGADRKHMWAWREGKAGIFSIDAAGRLHAFTHPTLATASVRKIHALGDSGYALVRFIEEKTQGVYLISSDVTAQPHILFEGKALVNVIPTKRGAWLVMTPPTGRIYSYHFLPIGAKVATGPWIFESDHPSNDPLSAEYFGSGWTVLDSTDRLILVSARSYSEGFAPRAPPASPARADTASFKFSLLDPVAGKIELTLRAPIAGTAGDEPMTVLAATDGKIWLSSSFLRGVALLDLDEVVATQKLVRASLQWMLQESFLQIRRLDDEHIFVFSLLETPRRAPFVGILSATLAGVHAELSLHVQSSNIAIEEVIPLNAQTALIQASGPAVPRSVFLWKAGEPLQRLKSREMLRPQADQKSAPLEFIPWNVLPSANGRAALLEAELSPNLMLHFDEKTLRLVSVLPNIPYRYRLFLEGQGGWFRMSDPRSGLRGIGFIDVETGVMSSPLAFSREPELPTVTPIPGVKAAFASRLAGTYRLDFAAGRIPLRVRLGAGEFDLQSPEAQTKLVFSSSAQHLDAHAMFTRELIGGLLEGAHATAHIACGNGAELMLVTPKIERLNEPVPLVLARRSKEDLPSHEPCTVSISYIDSLGSSVTWKWSNVRIVPATRLIDQIWFRSLLAYLAIVVLAFFVAQLRGGLQRWLPLATFVGGGAATSLLTTSDLINLWMLLGALAVTALIATAAGMISGSAFRSLVAMEPFRSAAPVMLAIPAVRRRIYESYVKRMRAHITEERKGPLPEYYVDLPVKIVSASDEKTGYITALEIHSMLCTSDPEQRYCVLVESPGGRGKSALLRRVIEVSLDAYKASASSPLPLLCSGVEGDLLARIRSWLGADGFPDEILKALLEAGEFFVVVDGVTESAVSSAHVTDYLASLKSGAPLLMSLRPNPEFTQEFQKHILRRLVLEPERLTDRNIECFLKAYGYDPRRFGEAARTVCRNIEGEYLPILVRLAILNPQVDPLSVKDVYANVIKHLVKGNDDLVDRAAALCHGTYWKTGRRAIRFETAGADRKAVLRDLLQTSLVVPTGTKNYGPSDPADVRFFHDSVQTYLTAVHLSRDRENWIAHVLEAAAEKRFSRESSDLLIVGATELYQMCLLTFGESDEVSGLLAERLRELVEKYAGAFSWDWIMRTPGLPLRAREIPSRASGPDVMLMVISMCEDERSFAAIAALFARTARLLWNQIEAKTIQAAGQQAPR